MGDKIKIETVIDANWKDNYGRVGERKRRLSVYYYKGRGIVLSIQTFTASEGFETTNLFGDGNTTVQLDLIARAKPKLLSTRGDTLRLNAETIHAEMAGWDDDAQWSKARRQEYCLRLKALLTGEPVEVAA